MTKYTSFSDWLDDVLEKFQISAGDIVSTNKEYSISFGDNLIAYWDRQCTFGYIDNQ